MTKYKSQAIHQRQGAVRCYLLLILPNFDESIHFGPSNSFRELSSVWKDDLAIRVSGKLFQMLRLNTLTFLQRLNN